MRVAAAKAAAARAAATLEAAALAVAAREGAARAAARLEAVALAEVVRVVVAVEVAAVEEVELAVAERGPANLEVVARVVVGWGATGAVAMEVGSMVRVAEMGLGVGLVEDRRGYLEGNAAAVAMGLGAQREEVEQAVGAQVEAGKAAVKVNAASEVVVMAAAASAGEGQVVEALVAAE